MGLVQTYGALNWVRIAQTLGTRTPKQCRERFHQNLKPSLNHNPITPEEGTEIERLVLEIGKRWAEIARRLNGRSDNAVKNWWNGSQNRRRRTDRRRSAQPGPSYSDAYPRSAGLPIPRSPLSVVPRLPPPIYAFSHPHGSPVAGSQHRDASSFEGTLPSPCSSDSTADPDAAPNYTTSPARSSLLSYRPAPVELPPLRTAAHTGHGGAQLPSLSSVTSPIQGCSGRQLPLPSLSPRDNHDQLPTAPSSPVRFHTWQNLQHQPQHQLQYHARHHAQRHGAHMGEQHGAGSTGRDTRMNLRTLLGS